MNLKEQITRYVENHQHIDEDKFIQYIVNILHNDCHLTLLDKTTIALTCDQKGALELMMPSEEDPDVTVSNNQLIIPAIFFLYREMEDFRKVVHNQAAEMIATVEGEVINNEGDETGSTGQETV